MLDNRRVQLVVVGHAGRHRGARLPVLSNAGVPVAIRGRRLFEHRLDLPHLPVTLGSSGDLEISNAHDALHCAGIAGIGQDRGEDRVPGQLHHDVPLLGIVEGEGFVGLGMHPADLARGSGRVDPNVHELSIFPFREVLVKPVRDKVFQVLGNSLAVDLGLEEAHGSPWNPDALHRLVLCEPVFPECLGAGTGPSVNRRVIGNHGLAGAIQVFDKAFGALGQG